MAHTITTTITKSGITQVTLATAGKFVDRDIEVKANVPASTTSISNNEVVRTSGWVEAGTVLAAGTLNNAPTASVSYAEQTGDNTVIPAGGKLYINEGYYPNMSISLGQLIPDDANVTNAGNAHIRANFEAYDTNGNQLIGTIADVTPTFTGGSVTATATGSVTTAPQVEVKATGTFTGATTYGVTSTKPSGTDGTAYLTIDGTGTATNGTVSAKANASRTAVLYKAAATGYIDVAKDTQASAAASATQSSANVTVTASVKDSFAPLYIPIVTSSVSGGVVTATATGSVSTAPKVTSSISGSVITKASTYGVTTSKPTGTDGTAYVTIAPVGSATNGTVSAQASAASTAVTEKHSAGAIAAHDGQIVAAGSDSDAVDVSVAPTADSGDSYYIPVATRTATVSSHTTVAGSAEAATSLAISNSNYSTTGITTSKPSSGVYITIAPTITSTAGSATAVAKATTSAGVVASGNSASSEDTKSVSVTTSTKDTRYIPVYDGSYTVS